MFYVFLLLVTVLPQMNSVKIAKSEFKDPEFTTCDDFSKHARFNPYSVLNERWFVFYYWAPHMPHLVFAFYQPTANETELLHGMLDGNVETPVNWTAKHVIMRDHAQNSVLLVERGDRGQYDVYDLHRDENEKYYDKEDVRFKQTGDNKYIAFMLCGHDSVYVMSRIKDVPPKNKIQDEVAKIGYRARGGKSYLYQGHEWMPIPEADEKEFWMKPSLRKRFVYQ